MPTTTRKSTAKSAAACKSTAEVRGGSQGHREVRGGSQGTAKPAARQEAVGQGGPHTR